MKIEMNTVKDTHLRQHLFFSSSSQERVLDCETLFLHSLFISKCLKLFDISSSSSSLELQLVVTESNCVPNCNFARWHSWNCIISTVQSEPELGKANGPDLSAGVLCRAGDGLLNGVWHLEVVELPIGVISVPISLCLTSWIASIVASFVGFPVAFPNKNPSFVGCKHLNLG